MLRDLKKKNFQEKNIFNRISKSIHQISYKNGQNFMVYIFANHYFSRYSLCKQNVLQFCKQLLKKDYKSYFKKYSSESNMFLTKISCISWSTLLLITIFLLTCTVNDMFAKELQKKSSNQKVKCFL